MLAMAAGRTSSSSGGGAGGGQWTSTRTHVSLSARNSPSTGAAAAAVSVSSSSKYDHEELLSSGGHGVTGASSPAGDGSMRMPTASSAYKSESEDEHQDDNDDEWEDVGDEPVFRDLKLFEPVEDSEYAPSENEDDNGDGDQQQISDNELSASDMEVEEEESSVAGLFASVVRQLGSATTKKRRGKDSSNHEDPAAFTEQDRQFWATPEEKQQWAARFDAANTQFVHRYGCRIDSPAHPEAKAKLRREKKKKNVYALILFALCVAFLVQMMALSTDTVLTVQSVADSVKKLTDGLPHPTDMYHSVLGKLSSLLPLSTSTGSESQAPARESVVAEEEAVVTVLETRVLEQTMSTGAQDVIMEQVAVLEDEAIAVHVETRTTIDETAVNEPVVKPETVQSVDELGTRSHDVEDSSNLDTSDGTLTGGSVSSKSPSVEKEESAHSKVAVQLCSKLLNRLVKSRYDPGVKDAAIRACDAAIAIAQVNSAHWIEAHVLRGDLFSLVSEFDAADEDYSAAAGAVAVVTSASQEEPNRLALSQEIQVKTLANRWISLFTKNKYKELRQEVGKVSKDDQQYSAPLRALAIDWLLVFKKKKQPLEVLTATKLCTLQRLEYA